MSWGPRWSFWLPFPVFQLRVGEAAQRRLLPGAGAPLRSQQPSVVLADAAGRRHDGSRNRSLPRRQRAAGRRAGRTRKKRIRTGWKPGGHRTVREARPRVLLWFIFYCLWIMYKNLIPAFITQKFLFHIKNLLHLSWFSCPVWMF